MPKNKGNPMARFRFPLMLVGTFAILALTEWLTTLGQNNVTWLVTAGFVLAVAAAVGYRWLSRVVEKRAAPEISVGDAGRRLVPGIAIGAAAFGLVMLIIRLLGGWQSQSDGSWLGLASTAGIMACVAVNEELVFRGVLVRIVAERFGGWVSLLLSSVLFGAIHLANPAATLWGAFSISVTAGLLFGAAYLAFRSLWLVIGIHFGWNVVQAGVFGVSSSGTGPSENSLFHTTLAGSDLLTGGAFGPEGSLVTVLLLGIPALGMVAYAAATGKLKRTPRPAAELPTESASA
jgi:uncharacterized protein